MPDSSPASLTRRQCLLASLGASIGLALPARAATSAAAALLAELAERYFESLLEADPLWASQLGLATPAQAARLTMEIAPAQRRAMARVHEAGRRELLGIERGALTATEQTLYELLDWTMADQAGRLQHPDHLLPLDQLGWRAPPFQLAAAAENGLSGFAGEADFAQHLERLRMLPDWCDQAALNMREGLKSGIVHPGVILQRLQPMLRGLAPAAPEQSPYLAPLQRLPQAGGAAWPELLRRQYRDCVERRLTSALRQLGEVLARDILPHGRASAGWSALPQGRDWYAQWVRSHTSTALSPQDIHALGLREVQGLGERMREIQRHYRHQGSLAEFLRWFEQRAEARPFKTERQVLDAYAALERRVATELPRLFGRLPRARLEIHPEPELTRNTASDHYAAPAPDGSRPGVFFAVIPDAASYPAATMASLFLHEGLPGHHLQVALAQELPLSRLQRFFFHTAYGEGWALYAETLGYPLGLYDDAQAHLGHLSMAQMRAVRLVVDTGLHALGWSREQAMAYFREHTGFSELNTRIQIERYMVSPGQALSYAIGRISIERLRERARAALGPRFTLSGFHDQLLDGGALPMQVLEAKLQRWIEARAAA